eukprot:TRINITY_DN318_c0_g2_i2.p1 TRINITY_DN318_c0_g2~~TRINITY_DN318_c0_g2_i2.p1  ORF type:complete len:486 (+),score=102.91 TRINITY_DN318_c0_g2_i2:50-1507(+)
MISWTSVLLAFFFVFLALLVRQYLQFLRLARQYPGGEDATFLRGHRGIGAVHRDNFTTKKFRLERLEKYGPINQLLMPLGIKRIVFSGNAELNELLMSTPVKPDFMFDAFVPMFGKSGIFSTTDVVKWKVLRGQFSHAFSQSSIRNQLPILSECFDNLVQYVSDTETPDGIVDVDDLLIRMGMDFIGLSNFGVFFDAVKNPTHPNVVLLGKIGGLMETLVLQHHLWFRKLVWRKEARESKKLIKDILQLLDKIVKNGREHFKQDSLDDRKNKTIFHQLLRIPSLSDDEVVSNALTFLFAGHDTTSHATSSLLMYLSKNPKCLKRALDELQEVDGEAPPSFDRVLARYPYMTLCAKEALRMNGPAPGTIRVLPADFSADGIYLKKGTLVSASSITTHYNPKYYTNPHEFDPLRFESDQLPKGAYVPFGTGPRNCIGQRFAVQQLVYIGASFLYQFEFELTEEPKYRQVFIREPVFGVKMKLTKREH